MVMTKFFMKEKNRGVYRTNQDVIIKNLQNIDDKLNLETVSIAKTNFVPK